MTEEDVTNQYNTMTQTLQQLSEIWSLLWICSTAVWSLQKAIHKYTVPPVPTVGIHALHAIIILYCVLLYDYCELKVTLFLIIVQSQHRQTKPTCLCPCLNTQLCLFEQESLLPGNVFPPHWGNESTLPCSLLQDALSHQGRGKKTMISVLSE